MSFEIIYDQTWEENFLQRINEDGPWATIEQYRLAYEATKLNTLNKQEDFVSLQYLPHLSIYPHQLDVAKQVIEEMHGKAILADEVGLGKTIEAGLILKEYLVRGSVKKVLILVPASLVSQWTLELNQKFFIPAVSPRKEPIWNRYDIIVSSIDTAKRSPNKEMILKEDYDLIIVDEAHKFKNHKTKNYAFLQAIKKKYCLLLTATPIQNELNEIYHLISLLKPGHLGNASTFQASFQTKKRDFTNDAELRALVNRVMIRNRRQDTHIDWTKRHIHNEFITLSTGEREIYHFIQALRLNKQLNIHPFSLLTLEREACSSKEAVFMTIKKWVQEQELGENGQLLIKQLLELLQQKTINSKAKKALEIVQSTNEKVIIFTGYRATQYYLQWFFSEHQITSVTFRGGFKQTKKDWMQQLFQTQAQVFIATEAGGEGINLQFCHHLINFDLPWNPMRLEQRIGRIHRLGQTEDVHIYNFAVKDTIEENVLRLLYEKIHMFERVIGELDEILTEFHEIDFEKYLTDTFASSTSQAEVQVKMNVLTQIIEAKGDVNPHEQRQSS